MLIKQLRSAEASFSDFLNAVKSSVNKDTLDGLFDTTAHSFEKDIRNRLVFMENPLSIKTVRLSVPTETYDYDSQKTISSYGRVTGFHGLFIKKAGISQLDFAFAKSFIGNTTANISQQFTIEGEHDTPL